MSKNQSSQPFAARVLKTGMAAALLLTLNPAVAQNAKEQTAPAIPVDLVALGAESAPVVVKPAVSTGENGDSKDAKENSKDHITDYTKTIGNGLKERERRLTLLNEAMMKLREAGELEDAGRVEERIRALLEMPPPSQASNKMRAEIEQLRAKNDELTLQLVALQEEVKHAKVPPSSSSGRKVAANTER